MENTNDSEQSIINIMTYNLLYKVADKPENIKKVCRDLFEYEKCDIVGLQEITETTKDLILKEMNGIKLGKFIKCKVGRTHIITSLNPKIELKGVCWDSFETPRLDIKGNVKKNSSGKIIKNRGRPFQILVCEYLGKDLLIINCHFPHIRKKDLEKVIIQKLSQNLTFGIKIDDSFPGGNPLKQDGSIDLKLDETYIKTNISDLIIGKKFKVIMLGDFNDAGKLNLYQGFYPFKTDHSKFLKNQLPENKKLLDKIKLGGSDVTKPPNSCCLSYNQSNNKFSGSFSKIGDYTIVDSSIKIVKDNYISKKVLEKSPDNSASDHLPVVLKVNLKPTGKKTKSSSKSADKGASKNNSKSQKLKYTCKLEKFKLKKSSKKKK